MCFPHLLAVGCAAIFAMSKPFKSCNIPFLLDAFAFCVFSGLFHSRFSCFFVRDTVTLSNFVCCTLSFFMLLLNNYIDPTFLTSVVLHNFRRSIKIRFWLSLGWILMISNCWSLATPFHLLLSWIVHIWLKRHFLSISTMQITYNIL